MEKDEDTNFFQIIYSPSDQEWHIQEIRVKDINAYYSKEEAVRVAIELAQQAIPEDYHLHTVMVQKEDGGLESIGQF